MFMCAYYGPSSMLHVMQTLCCRWLCCCVVVIKDCARFFLSAAFCFVSTHYRVSFRSGGRWDV